MLRSKNAGRDRGGNAADSFGAIVKIRCENNVIGIQYKVPLDSGRKTIMSINLRTKVALLAITVFGITPGCGLGMSDSDRVARALQALDAGEYQAAIVDTKDVLRRDPENVEARVILGEASLLSGDAAGAEKEIRRAIDLGASSSELHPLLVSALVAQRKFQEAIDAGLDPTLTGEQAALVRRLRGDAYQGLRQPEDALREYEAALAANPDDIDAHLGVARSYLVTGNPGQARNNLDVLIDRYPENTDVWLASAELNVSLRRLDDASSHYEVVLDIAGEDLEARADALFGLAEIVINQRDAEAARGYVDELATLAPGALRTDLVRARLAMLEEDWQGANTLLQDVLSRAPDFQPALLLIGAVSLQLKSYAQVEVYLSTLLAKDPTNVSARLLLHDIYRGMRDTDRAGEVLAPELAQENPDPRIIAAAARLALSAGDTDRAISDLQRSLEADPMNTGVQIQLALALVSAGRADEVSGILDRLALMDTESTAFERDLIAVLVRLRNEQVPEALADVGQLTAKWPDQPNAFLLRGVMELTSGSADAARQSFEEALKIDPESTSAKRYLGQLDEREENWEAAAARYEGILNADSSDTSAMYGLARVAAEVQDFDGSKEWLQRLLQVEPDSYPARATLARLHMQTGEPDLAVDVARGLVLLNRDSAESHVLLGGMAYQAGEYETAIEAFTDALRLDPTDTRVRDSLANAQRRSGDAEAAIQTLGGQTAELDYTDLGSSTAMAVALAQAGNIDSAMEIAMNLQAAQPDAPEPLALEGELWVIKRDFGRARAAFDKAMEIDLKRPYAIRQYEVLLELGDENAVAPLQRYLSANPGDPRVLDLTAQNAIRSGDLNAAIPMYEQVVAAEPNNGSALNNLAYLYYLTGDSRAVDTAREARDALPQDGSVLDTLGWILIEAGEIDEGIRVLEEAVRRSGGAAVVRYHLADAFSRKGDKASARRVLEALLEEHSEFQGRDEAVRMLADL